MAMSFDKIDRNKDGVIDREEYRMHSVAQQKLRFAAPEINTRVQRGVQDGLRSLSTGHIAAELHQGLERAGVPEVMRFMSILTVTVTVTVT